MKKFNLLLTGLSLMASAAYAAPADEIIAEEPAGEVQWYSCMSVAYSPSVWGIVGYATTDGVARKVIFGEDGNVYFRDPISLFPTSSYVKGSREGNRITVTVPQTIMVDTDKNGDENVWTIGLFEGRREWDAEYNRYKTVWSETDRKEICFDLLDNGTIRQSEDDGALKLTLFCNGAEMVYADTEIVMNPVDPTREAVKFPENVEPETWTFSYKLNARRAGRMVEAVMVDDEMYVRGFWEKYPNATVKGRIEDGRLVIPSGQYLGWIEKGRVSYFEYIVSYVPGRESMMQYYMLTDDDLVFDMNPERTEFTLSEEGATGIIIKGGSNVAYEVDFNQFDFMIERPGFRKKTGGFLEPQAPEYINDMCRSYPQVPCVSLEFAMLPFDILGNALAPSDLRYSMWVDGEKVMFDANDFEPYEDLPEPTDELPLDFQNDWGMYYRNDNVFQRVVELSGCDMDRIGAQTVFYDPETGERKVSKIAWLNVQNRTVTYEDEPSGSGVEGTSTPEREVIGEEWFDLLGNPVGKDYKGVCIRSVRYSDGSVSAGKRVR